MIMKRALPLFLIFTASTAYAAGGSITDIANVILDTVIRPFIYTLMIVATLTFIWGIIEYIINADSEDGRSTGRRHMIWGILGLAIMFSAAGIITVFQNFWAGIS